MLRSGWGDESSPFWRAISAFFFPNATVEQRWHFDLQHTAYTLEPVIAARKALDEIDVSEQLRLSISIRSPLRVANEPSIAFPARSRARSLRRADRHGAGSASMHRPPCERCA